MLVYEGRMKKNSDLAFWAWGILIVGGIVALACFGETIYLAYQALNYPTPSNPTEAAILHNLRVPTRNELLVNAGLAFLVAIFVAIYSAAIARLSFSLHSFTPSQSQP